MKYAAPPATIALMTGLEAKRFLFFRWMAERWQSFERRQGLAQFRRRFTASPYRMVVVLPDFARFDAKFDQTFVYVPIAGAGKRKTTWSPEELAFFQRCLDRTSPRGASGTPGVATIGSRYLGADGDGWTASFAEIEKGVAVMSKEACVERLLPTLAGGIGPEQGGLYAPYGGDGVYLLSSL
jgi:hypothetical protein